jgi:hypothetical protein
LQKKAPNALNSLDAELKSAVTREEARRIGASSKGLLAMTDGAPLSRSIR